MDGDPGDDDHPPRHIRLMLSGGDTRAMMGGIGSILFLADAGHWPRIKEIVSVSGGSTVNAALLTLGGDTADEAIDAMRVLFERKTSPRRYPPGAAARIAIGPLAVVGAVVSSATGLLPVPRVVRHPAVAVAIGAAALPVALQSALRGIGSYMADDLAESIDADGRLLSDFSDREIQHVICASGLTSAAPYFFWAGGGDEFTSGGDPAHPDPKRRTAIWGAAIPAPGTTDVTLAEALMASSSQPVTGRVWSPRTRDDAASDVLLRDPELLIDGGAQGMLGVQLVEPVSRPPAAAVRSASNWRVIVVDAGKHAAGAGPVTRRLRRMSVAWRLARWLQVSQEAIYVGDLADLRRHGVRWVRVCEQPIRARTRRRRGIVDATPTGSGDHGIQLPDFVENELGPDLRHRQQQMRVAPGATSDSTEPAPDPIEERLAVLRRRTSSLSSVNIDQASGRSGVVCGFVATMTELVPDVDDAAIVDALRRAGERFGQGAALAETWAVDP